MTTPPSSLPPANWYPDPQTPGQLRYWDGQRWTQHVHPAQPPAQGVGGAGAPTQASTGADVAPEQANPAAAGPAAGAQPNAQPGGAAGPVTGAQPTFQPGGAAGPVTGAQPTFRPGGPAAAGPVTGAQPTFRPGGPAATGPATGAQQTFQPAGGARPLFQPVGGAGQAPGQAAPAQGAPAQGGPAGAAAQPGFQPTFAPGVGPSGPNPVNRAGHPQDLDEDDEPRREDGDSYNPDQSSWPSLVAVLLGVAALATTFASVYGLGTSFDSYFPYVAGGVGFLSVLFGFAGLGRANRGERGKFLSYFAIGAGFVAIALNTYEYLYPGQLSDIFGG